MGKNGILKNKAGEQIFPATTADQVAWNDRMNLKQAISEKLGAPYAASTVSSMTDRTRIYVYTGDESGYTKGNWYYWNGSSWVSGGVYNSVAVETDKTLTVAGKAADGEVVGQEIGSLKESIENETNTVNSIFKEEYLATTVLLRGAVSNGKKYIANDTRLVLAYSLTLNKFAKIIAPDGFEIKAYIYSDKVTNINAETVFPEITGEIDWCTTLYKNIQGNYVISYRKKDGTSITNDEMEFVKNYGVKGYSSGLKCDDDINELKRKNENMYTTISTYNTANGYAIGTTSGRGYIYPSSNPSIKYINLKKGERIIAKCSNLNRCRVFVFYNKFDDIIKSTNVSVAQTSDETIYCDDTLTTVTIDYKAPIDCCLCLYLSNNRTDKVECSVTDYSDKMPTELIHVFDPFDEDYSTSTTDIKTLDIDSDTFVKKFYSRYLGRNKGVFCTKELLGKDESNTYDIWQYSFEPISRECSKTILLSGGMHPYELPASFGLARWIQEYMTSDDEAFKYLRENVRVVVIPVINVWGFNQTPKTYGNCNGVNPNRNFDDWNNVWESFPVYSSNPNDDNYNEWNVKGSTPFSESETNIIKEWLYKYQDAEFWIDCHTGLNCEYGDVWCLYSKSNPLKGKIRKAIDALKTHISQIYNVDAKEYVQIDLASFAKGYFGTDVVGIPTMVIEQQQGDNTKTFATVPNNNPTQIHEYATQIHAYVIAQLQD